MRFDWSKYAVNIYQIHCRSNDRNEYHINKFRILRVFQFKTVKILLLFLLAKITIGLPKKKKGPTYFRHLQHHCHTKDGGWRLDNRSLQEIALLFF